MNRNKTGQYIKPKAHSISSWDSRKEILYGCPKCNADFRILGQQVKYCFNCGVGIDWDVLTHLSESIDSLYNKHCNKGHTDLSQDEFEKEIVKTVNKRQGYTSTRYGSFMGSADDDSGWDGE